MSIPYINPPKRSDNNVTGVSFSSPTLTLTRADEVSLTTTIATTGSETKISNGTSKMEIASADGACAFTPNGDAAKTTTFAADGKVELSSAGLKFSDDTTMTTATTGNETKISNGSSKMEIASADGACAFTPNGDAAKTTTFAADGKVELSSAGLKFSDDTTMTTVNTSDVTLAADNAFVGENSFSKTITANSGISVTGNITQTGVITGIRSTIKDATVDTAIDNRLEEQFTTAAGFTCFDRSIILERTTGYRPYELGMLGNNTSNSNVFCIASNGGGGHEPNAVFAIGVLGKCEIAGDLYVGGEIKINNAHIQDDTGNTYSVSSGNPADLPSSTTSYPNSNGGQIDLVATITTRRANQKVLIQAVISGEWSANPSEKGIILVRDPTSPDTNPILLRPSASGNRLRTLSSFQNYSGMQTITITYVDTLSSVGTYQYFPVVVSASASNNTFYFNRPATNNDVITTIKTTSTLSLQLLSS